MSRNYVLIFSLCLILSLICIIHVSNVFQIKKTTTQVDQLRGDLIRLRDYQIELNSRLMSKKSLQETYRKTGELLSMVRPKKIMIIETKE